MLYLAADLHIDAVLRKTVKDFKEDGYKMFLKFIDGVIADETDEEKIIYLAGDIFNRHSVNGTTLYWFKEAMRRCAESHIKVYYIRGNHDTDDGVGIADTQGAINANERLREHNGVSVYAIEYKSTDLLKKALEEAPACDLLILHSPFEHLLSFEGAYQLTLEDIPERVKNVFVGDIHVNNVTKLGNRGKIVSPGPLHPCSWDQKGPFGYYKFNGKEFKFKQLDYRNMYSYVVDSSLDVEKLVTFLKTKKNEFRGIVELRYQVEHSDIAKQIKDRCPEFIYLDKGLAKQNILENSSGEEVKEEDKELTLIEVLPFLVNPQKDKEIFQIASDLLSAVDSTVVSSLLEEYTKPKQEK